MFDLTVYPPEIVDTIKALKPTQGWFKTIEPHPLIYPTCPVCNDGKMVIFEWPQNGPYESFPSFSPGHDSSLKINMGKDGKYWACKQVVAPCIACNARQLRIDKYWQDSGLLETERDWRLDYYAKTEKEIPVMALNGWLSEAPNIRGMKIFYGVYGMGKTGMGKAMVAALIRAGVRAKHLTAEDFLAECRETFGDKEISDNALVAEYATYRFLVLDEVDPERVTNTSYGNATLTRLINKRYESRMINATMLISNQEPDDLWPYLASRLEDAERIRVGGQKLRGRTDTNLLGL